MSGNSDQHVADWLAAGHPHPGSDAPSRLDGVRVAVVIPCHRVRNKILDVIAALPPFVYRIYVVDDACPEQSGEYVRQHCTDRRVTVLVNDTNLGVGGAVMAGYRLAADESVDILVKVDGDGQMDPAAMPQLLAPILRGQADYTKGNRFYDLAQIGRMPGVRIAGNAALSFMTKISSGYWDIFDPTNGYTAIHARVVAKLPLDKISQRYFFETDMLFRLNTLRAVVVDVPIDARYGDEVSNMKVSRIVFEFFFKHARNTGKRLFYNYLLRDLSLASIELLVGMLFVTVGTGLGLAFWLESYRTGVTTSAGGVMLVALQVIVGIQLILGFLAYDIASVPRRPLHPLLPPLRPERDE